MEPLTLILLAIVIMAVLLYLMAEAVKAGAKVQERSESFSQLPPAEKLKKRAATAVNKIDLTLPSQ